MAEQTAGTKPEADEFEEYLNELGTPQADLESNGGRIPDSMPYGTWLRKNDSIAFWYAMQNVNTGILDTSPTH